MFVCFATTVINCSFDNNEKICFGQQLLNFYSCSFENFLAFLAFCKMAERNVPGVAVLKLQKDEWDLFYPQKTLDEVCQMINKEKRSICIRHMNPDAPDAEHLHVFMALKFRNKKRPALRNLLTKCADQEGRAEILDHLVGQAKMVDEDDVQNRVYALKHCSDFIVQMPDNLKSKFSEWMMHPLYHSLLAENPPHEYQAIFCDPPIEVEEQQAEGCGEASSSEDQGEDGVKIANPAPPDFITLKGNAKNCVPYSCVPQKGGVLVFLVLDMYSGW